MDELDGSGSSDSDSFTESSHVGFGSKLGGSLMAMVFGFVLIIGSIGGLWWNEGRAVTTARSLSEGAGLVLNVDATRVDPQNDGRLVHVSGPLATTDALTDTEFLVSVRAAVLHRHVEMYQWDEDSKTETRKNFGGSEERVKTYTYKKKWSSRPIDSGQFKQASNHRNPPMRWRDRTVLAKDATLGAFRPGEAALRKLRPDETFHIDQSQAGPLAARAGGSKVHVVDGTVYVGADPSNPAVGDYRVTFKIAAPATATFLGRQTGNDLAPYQTKAGDSLLFARSGAVSATDIFAAAKADNRTLTWIIRLAGVLFMFFGFALLSAPLVALGDIVPVIGSVIGGVGAIAALVMTTIAAPMVIALAWLWHRPLVSLGVLAAGLCAAFLAKRAAPERKPKSVPFLPPMQARRGGQTLRRV